MSSALRRLVLVVVAVGGLLLLPLASAGAQTTPTPAVDLDWLRQQCELLRDEQFAPILDERPIDEVVEDCQRFFDIVVALVPTSAPTPAPPLSPEPGSGPGPGPGPGPPEGGRDTGSPSASAGSTTNGEIPPAVDDLPDPGVIEVPPPAPLGDMPVEDFTLGGPPIAPGAAEVPPFSIDPGTGRVPTFGLLGQEPVAQVSDLGAAGRVQPLPTAPARLPMPLQAAVVMLSLAGAFLVRTCLLGGIFRPRGAHRARRGRV